MSKLRVVSEISGVYGIHVEVSKQELYRPLEELIKAMRDAVDHWDRSNDQRVKRKRKKAMGASA